MNAINFTKHIYWMLAIATIIRAILLLLDATFKIFQYGTWHTNFSVFILITAFFVTIAVEIGQKSRHPMTYNYLDSFFDILFGNLYFWIPMMLGNPVWHEWIR